MNDEMISRKAALDALKEVSEHYTDKGREWHPHVDFMVQAIEELPSVQPEQRWIPVTERLPKPNEREEDGVQRYYLIQNEFKDMMVAAYRENHSGHTWWEQMYAYKPIKDKVIAWMPLPATWKGGAEDEQ